MVLRIIYRTGVWIIRHSRDIRYSNLYIFNQKVNVNSATQIKIIKCADVFAELAMW